MKKIFLSLTLGAALICAGCNATTTDERVYPYTFNTARIEYSSNGAPTPNVIVTIKGDKQLFQTSGETNTLMIVDKDKLSYISLDSKTGTTTANQTYVELKKLPKDQRMNYLMATSIGLKLTNDGQSIPASSGQKQVAGQTCDLYDSDHLGKVCLWNGIPLELSVGTDNGTDSKLQTTVATKVEVGIDVPDNTFDVPQGIEMKDPAA